MDRFVQVIQFLPLADFLLMVILTWVPEANADANSQFRMIWWQWYNGNFVEEGGIAEWLIPASQLRNPC